LASIRTISSTYPIKGKDRVEMAVVDGWTCMVSKADNFKPGSPCVFCEPDSVFPQTERWEFLKKYNYRIKTQKFKDEDGNAIYSQGLVLPMSAVTGGKVGDDVTEQLGITQYEKTMDIEKDEPVKSKNPLMRYKWFRNLNAKLFGNVVTRERFPEEVSKTDEERIQNCPNKPALSAIWTMTEKVDGQSGTFLLRKHKGLFGTKYEFVVCSRNFKTNNKNTSYWKCAEKYHIEEALKNIIGDNEWICLQGECLGPGIQGNKYKFTDYEFRGFNLITPKKRLGSGYSAELMAEQNIPWVPILGEISGDQLMELGVDGILRAANGPSKLNPNTKREGIVFRSTNGTLSFKAVSPEFLIKYNE
jgi:hypothetical protein